jgi:hypothetical protein
METSYTFNDLISDILDETKMPMSAQEIWDRATESKLDEKVGSAGKTPWATINARLYLNIKEKSEDSTYVQVSRRPARFILRKHLSNASQVSAIGVRVAGTDESSEKVKFGERDLHPLLVKFMRTAASFNCVVKTIYHENSTRRTKGANEWLHPDLVGVYFPFEDYIAETIDLQKHVSVSTVNLFAFEMKIQLNFSNLRQSFFQAVSNTSWAHEGYLVCLKIDEDRDFINELQRLSNSFGVGVIRLNAKSIHESEILFHSQLKDEIDWDTVNRLAEDSPDFKRFLSDLTEDIKLSKVKSSYDSVLDDESFESYLREKKIS